MHLAERVKQEQARLEQSKMVAESSSEKFAVDPDLLKFVVGTKGANIHKARGIPGVLNISIDDEKHMVMIYAETSEAAKKARLLLEFTEEHYLVPRSLVGRIIGQKGKSIQDIIDKSQVLKVKVLSEDDAKSIPGADDPTVCAFKFIGTRMNNQNAKALMDYLVQSLKEIDELQDQQKQIEKEIDTYNIAAGMTSFTLNGNDRSSGYSSDTKDSTNKYRRPRKEGEYTDSGSESTRNGKGNYRNRNHKSRDNRIEEHKRTDHIEHRNTQPIQQNKPKMNRFEMLEQIPSEGVTFGADEWSEVPLKKEYSSRDGKGYSGGDVVKGPYARVAAGLQTGSGDKKSSH